MLTDNEMGQFYRMLSPKGEDLPVAQDEVLVDLYPAALYPQPPIEALAAGIRWGGRQSAQLFSGFRGSGKSTALRQLKAQLERQGALVFLIDALDYLNPTMPIDLSDFLLVLAGAIGDKANHQQSFWDIGEGLLRRWSVTGLELGEGVKLSVAFKHDPHLRARFQERMAGHVTALVHEVRDYLGQVLSALRRDDPNRQVVVLVDSLEQLSGTSVNAEDVAASAETLFLRFATQLQFDAMHVIYSVPPWLRAKAPGLVRLYGGYAQLPCVPVRDRARAPQRVALDLMEQVLAKRGDWRAVLDGDPLLVDELALASGGYLRDLLLLMRTTLRYRRDGRLSAAHAVQLAISELRDQFAGASLSELRVLRAVHETQDINAAGEEGVGKLGRLFDQMLILNYLQYGDERREWYDVHPAILPKVEALARAQA